MSRRGQSLIEVLVATAVGAIMIIGALTIIGPALRGGTDAGRVQAASALGKALLENLRAWAEADWHNLSDLATSSANRYFLDSSNSPFRAVTGTESITQENIPNLIAHWKLDETGGTKVFDFSTNTRHGTSTGGPTATSSCLLAGCFIFDGTDDYVAIPDMVQTVSTTLSLWFNQTSSKTALLFASTDPSNSDGEFAVMIYNTGRVESYHWIAGGGDRPHLRVTAPATSAASYNAWHHVAAVYDKTTGYAHLYLDGEHMGSSNTTLFSSTWQGGIGAGSGGSYWFNGKIDDVRVYDRGFPESEIKTLYRAQVFNRYFYLDEVNRDSSGYITAGAGTRDPSTLKATIVYGTQTGATTTIQTYLTRFKNRIFRQTDWSGGIDQEGPVTSTNNRFATSTTNLNYTTTTGSIELQFQ